jgi:hypothetical protein
MQPPDHFEPATKYRAPGNPTWSARRGQRFVNPNHPAWEMKVSRALATPRPCEVEGCGTTREDVGRYCTHHRNRLKFHGHPTAGHLPRKYLGTWIVLAERYLAQLDALEDGHPARQQLVLARHWWSVQVASSDGYAAVNWRQHQSHETRWRRYVSAISRHGFTVDRVLALVAAFYVAREVLSAMLQSDQHERFQLARLVLQSVNIPMPAWHTRPGDAEIPGLRFMLWAGEKLQKALGLFAGSCAMAIMGNAFGGFPSPEDTRPVSKTAATRAAARPRFKPLTETEDGE